MEEGRHCMDQGPSLLEMLHLRTIISKLSGTSQQMLLNACFRLNYFLDNQLFQHPSFFYPECPWMINVNSSSQQLVLISKLIILERRSSSNRESVEVLPTSYSTYNFERLFFLGNR